MAITKWVKKTGKDMLEVGISTTEMIQGIKYNIER